MRAPFRGMIMCHMCADSLEELLEMADRIGVARRWFQDKGLYPHFDICLSKRKLAVESGAMEITAREMVEKAKALRQRIRCER
jgi:hypothetical protein